MWAKFFNRRNKLTDNELIEKYRLEDNPVYLGEFFYRYYDFLYLMASKYFKAKEDREDYVMSLYEYLLEETHKNEVHSPKNWLYAVSRHFFLREVRKLRKHVYPQIEHNLVEEFIAEENTKQEKIKQEGLFKLLEKVIEELKPDQAECIQLFYLERLSYLEIVDKTGHDIKKVKSYIQNGKRNIKIKLEENGYVKDYNG
jgi:RNA polymerase sigma factor (sigma-70 family)